MTLSDKIYEVEQECNGYTPEIVIAKDDVKEFIKQVAEDIEFRKQFGQISQFEVDTIIQNMNELAGDKLI